MKKDNLRLVIIILLTGVCSLLIFKTTFIHEIDNKNLNNFPYTINDWGGGRIYLWVSMYIEAWGRRMHLCVITTRRISKYQ